MIADGADVTPAAIIHAAARRGHLKVLHLLIGAGAKLTGDDGSVLHTAAMGGQDKAVKALIDAGIAFGIPTRVLWADGASIRQRS